MVLGIAMFDVLGTREPYRRGGGTVEEDSAPGVLLASIGRVNRAGSLPASLMPLLVIIEQLPTGELEQPTAL
jgi:hypothetical protein